MTKKKPPDSTFDIKMMCDQLECIRINRSILRRRLIKFIRKNRNLSVIETHTPGWIIAKLGDYRIQNWAKNIAAYMESKNILPK